MSNRGVALVRECLRAIFTPKEIKPASKWVEDNIRLSQKTSHIAGRYSLRHTPYFRALFDDVDNPRVRKIVLKKSAQIGATQYAANVILYYICNHAFPVLMVFPSKESAQQFSERSLSPSLDNCKAIKPYLTGNPDDLKKTEFLFKNCIVRIIGAGSPSKLASNPACLCIIDEVDKGEDFASQGEAPALELAEDRTITYPNDKKIIILSTPTTTNTSVINAQYLLGSQCEYFVFCPKCNKEQILKFERLKWEDCKLEDGSYDIDKVERNTFYECETCKARLTEVDKLEMVRGGRWIDSNSKPFPREIRSYHISALYSFNITWGAMAKLFLLAKSDVGKLRNFYNSYLGECFEQRAETLKPIVIDELIKLSPKYNKGELHEKPQVILASFDCQGLGFWYGVEAIFNDGSSAVIDWGAAATFSDVEAVSQRQYSIQGTVERVGIARSLIDIGYKTDEVCDFIIKMGGRFTGVKGVSRRDGLFNPVGENTKQHKGNNIPILLVNDDYFKNLLYLSGFKQRTFAIYFPQDSDDNLKRQCTSENLVEKKTKTGKLETFWVCSNRNNHIGDCLKYIEGCKFKLEPALRAARQKILAPVVEEPKREYTLHLTSVGGGDWD